MYQNEFELEKYFIDEFRKLGWNYIESRVLLRDDYEEQLLIPNLKSKLRYLNVNLGITDIDIDRVINELKLTPTGIEGGKKILTFFKQGIPIKYEKDKVVKYTKLFDFDNIENNEFIVSNQVIHSGLDKIRNDIILYINGIPLVNIELKDPTNPAESWVNAYNQITDYIDTVPELYKYTQIGIGANANARYFPIVPWKKDVDKYEWKEKDYDSVDSVIKMLNRNTLLDLIKNFLFIRVEKGETTKVIARYMQLRAVNSIVNRVVDYYLGKDNKDKGLIWHWQGSGKTLEMITAANKLQFLDILENPTQFLIVDRDDLQNQLSREYNALDIKKPIVIDSIDKLKEIISSDSFKGQRGIFIVLIHKFRPGEFDEISNLIEKQIEETIATRKNVICFIDEGHRSQYGLLAGQRNSILKNAFFFAFTGTPIAKTGKNTYSEFSYPPEENYLDKYFILESIQDGFTKRITHQSRLDSVHLNIKHLETFLETEYEEIPENYREEIKDDIRQRLNPLNLFLEDKERIKVITKDIAKHFKENVEGNFKAMIVTASRKACVRYKRALDEHLPPSYSEVVMTYDPTRDSSESEINVFMKEQVKNYHGMDVEQIRKKVVEDFNEEENPKILIVTDMLLTGFDAPILQTMYLDKPLKEQRLLQAIARTNRPFNEKETGLIIDYVGIFDRIEEAFKLYEKDDLAGAILNTDKLKEEFVKTIIILLSIFVDIERDYKKTTLQKTIEIITSNKDTETKFVTSFKSLRKLFEFLGSEEIKLEHLKDYKWLMGVYTNYVKIVLKDQNYEEYLKKYFKKTLQLIHNETEVINLVKLPVQTIIDEKYIKDLRDKIKEKNIQTSNFVFTLNKFVLVDQHKNPVYESLVSRVEKLVKDWRDRIQQNADITNEFNEAESISQEIIELQEKQKEFGLSNIEMSAWLTIKTLLKIETDENLLRELKELFDGLKDSMIPGWTKNFEMKKNVENKLRDFIFLKIRPKYPMMIEQINDLHDKVSDKLISYGD